MSGRVVLSSSAFNDAARCLKRYEYRHVLNLVPRPRDARPAMRRGTWIHRCLELHDRGLPWTDELNRLAEWAVQHEVSPEAVAVIESETHELVSDYIAFWSGKHGPEAGPFETVDTEVRYEYSPRPSLTLSATLDRLVRDSKGRLWMFERKSTSDLPDSDWRNVDPQTLIQLAAARLGEGLNVSGIIFDYVRTDPGPSVRVYKPNKQGRGGHIYDDVINKAVTSRAFDEAIPQIIEHWQPDATCNTWQEYAEAMRVRMVQPESFFQRYMVLRPDESMIETLRDAAVVAGQVRRAQETDHYARAIAITDCRLFCPYMKLCFREYALGRPSEALREELFDVLTPEARAEGRTQNG